MTISLFKFPIKNSDIFLHTNPFLVNFSPYNDAFNLVLKLNESCEHHRHSSHSEVGDLIKFFLNIFKSKN